jgi:hypothetical protein
MPALSQTGQAGIQEPASSEAALLAVEITPEMLAAGASIVEAWDYDSPSLSASTHAALATLVYQAMKRLEPPQGQS